MFRQLAEWMRLAAGVTWTVIFVAALFWFVSPSVLGALTALLLFGFILPVLPGVVEFLSNKPNRFRPRDDTERNYAPDTFGFFTFLQPGRVKMIERGDSFVRAIMDWDERVFQGELANDLTPDQWKYWEVVETPRGARDSHPIPFPMPKISDEDHPHVEYEERRWLLWLIYAPLSILFWLWKRWIYFVTGGVFTGIPPYQTVRTYRMERFKILQLEDGETRLDRVLDYSDHYRVAQFQFPTAVPRADSQNMIQVSWKLNQIAHVVNPFMVAYNTDDDWWARFFASIANAVTTVSRRRPADRLVASAEGDDAAALATEVGNEMRAAVEDFGIRLDRTEIIDISFTDDAIRAKLGDVAVARVDRQAAEERAKGHAATLREQAQVLHDLPEAVIIAENEKFVRTAQAAGNKAIINLGGDGRGSRTPAAILKELRELNPERREAP